MVDKFFTVRRTHFGATIGRLENAEMARLDAVLSFVLGLAD